MEYDNLKKSSVETHRLRATGGDALSERSRRIENIIGRRFVPNASRTCIYIRSDSKRDFTLVPIVGNNSNVRIGFHMT